MSKYWLYINGEFQLKFVTLKISRLVMWSFDHFPNILYTWTYNWFRKFKNRTQACKGIPQNNDRTKKITESVPLDKIGQLFVTFCRLVQFISNLNTLSANALCYINNLEYVSRDLINIRIPTKR